MTGQSVVRSSISPLVICLSKSWLQRHAIEAIVEDEVLIGSGKRKLPITKSLNVASLWHSFGPLSTCDVQSNAHQLTPADVPLGLPCAMSPTLCAFPFFTDLLSHLRTYLLTRVNSHEKHYWMAAAVSDTIQFTDYITSSVYKVFGAECTGTAFHDPFPKKNNVGN